MFSFRKEERLNSITHIKTLFASGDRNFEFPLQAIYLPQDQEWDFPVKVLIGVPKKKIRKSVHRNLIKRRIREAYRLNKHLLYRDLKEQNKKILLALIYQSNRIQSFREIEKSIIAIFGKIGASQ